MEKWCHICIVEARNKGMHGKTVILTDTEHCESAIHYQTPLVLAIRKRKEKIMRRDLNGRFIPELS
ncbi:MAG: hypothetical protein WED05_02940 [Candidatus Atabeyarchaeum deiterrae]|jgi:hypothetical protein